MTKPEKKIPLVEKFGPTIQGEGATIGLQTYFLRFGLCDYDCVMCDSRHAVDPFQVKANAKWMTQEEIANLFTDTTKDPTQWITLSGGNPCIHDLTKLVQLLKAQGYKITVETQGTACPGWLNNVDIVTVSPKGPGMGEKFEEDKYRYFISSMVNANLNTKVVIFDDLDIDFAKDVARIWAGKGFSMDGFYLSQGNPFPPLTDAAKLVDTQEEHISILRERYLHLFDVIKTDPILARAKWLPQFHVWLWANKQGV